MNTALLTIDDVSSKNTPAIVDYLNSKGIRAIMFAVGEWVEQYWDEAVYALRHGMIIGNHSYSHPHFSEISFEEGVREIERCEDVLNRLYAAAGVERVWRPFRFPYGDKGGDNREALQAYFREQGFHKVEDRHLTYEWWKRWKLNTDVDTFWTFDFAEWQMPGNPAFRKEQVWERMHDEHPSGGAVLFAENNRHILLLHAHDETEAILPEYWRLFIDHLLENGITFDEPAFMKTPPSLVQPALAKAVQPAPAKRPLYRRVLGRIRREVKKLLSR
ncbi:MAG: polysaccharide deacetylase family protein [Clostridia bacterium]|nr:polysaccharide deacetylase family protein [Clostridia bacterium]